MIIQKIFASWPILLVAIFSENKSWTLHFKVIYWVALNAFLFWVNGPVEGCELLRSLNRTQMIPVVEVDGCNAMGNNYYLMVRIELRNYINISRATLVYSKWSRELNSILLIHRYEGFLLGWLHPDKTRQQSDLLLLLLWWCSTLHPLLTQITLHDDSSVCFSVRVNTIPCHPEWTLQNHIIIMCSVEQRTSPLIASHMN